MKILIVISVLYFATSCTGGRHKAPATIQEDSILYPYSPVYTDTFEKGKAVNSLKVLKIWKEFESGDVRHIEGYFSDTITMLIKVKKITSPIPQTRGIG